MQLHLDTRGSSSCDRSVRSFGAPIASAADILLKYEFHDLAKLVAPITLDCAPRPASGHQRRGAPNTSRQRLPGEHNGMRSSPVPAEGT
jgi:hypothetical protein